MGAEGRVTATTRYALSNVATELEAHYLELRGELPVSVELGVAVQVGEAPAPV
jgi:hypothetical protein